MALDLSDGVSPDDVRAGLQRMADAGMGAQEANAVLAAAIEQLREHVNTPPDDQA